MKTANDFARCATELQQLAEQMRPASEAEAHANARNVAVYHLRCAARLAKDVAEALAAKENAG